MTSVLGDNFRPEVRGKFLFAGNQKLYVRGVTYGTFRTDPEGSECHDPDTVEKDFSRMPDHGINAIRTYTVPPLWLLDAAHRHKLRVMIGLPWEQHIAFLDDRKRADHIDHRLRASVRPISTHPAILSYMIGNEIPASVVRWHGARKIERYLKRLYQAVQDEDPGSLISYVNYPSTEYLDLPFLDFRCFNVYLESQDDLRAYLARLQTLACNRPLIMGEIGIDSRRNGECEQSNVVRWQIQTAFNAGCAGVFVFSWTDEWFRGGQEIEDWDFGITRRDRAAKPALDAVGRAFAEAPLSSSPALPFISVVVCSYNGSRTIAATCEALCRLEYPNFEVIVVDDGSKDDTANIAGRYGFRMVCTENHGLSSARNAGLAAASGDIVAYTDDDAQPDSHWLLYLASTFCSSDHAAVGGPNIAPNGESAIAECVANAPGGPIHVLISDDEAEHIPGCNMAVRTTALQAIGGFDPRFRTAGDDVDLCWRLQERGWTIGFNPAAMVWHSRRGSLRAYWRQQIGYGQAEALLEEKWPEKYNSAGHVSWRGRLYGAGLTVPIPWGTRRIYGGTWGGAPFQSVYESAHGTIRSLPLMPEWYFLSAALGLLSLLGILDRPLLFVLPLFIVAVSASVMQAVLSGRRADFVAPGRSRWKVVRLQAMTSLLHLVQPLARLGGRARLGLTPWRRRGMTHLALPLPGNRAVWQESWRPPDLWLSSVRMAMRENGVVVRCGDEFSRWDLEARGGPLGRVRMRLLVEDHAGGKQLARFRMWPRSTRLGAALIVGLTGIVACAVAFRSWGIALVIGVAALAVLGEWLLESGFAMHAVHEVVSSESNAVNT